MLSSWSWKDVRTIQHYFARVSIIHSAALFAVQRDFLWDVPIQRRAEIRDLFRFFLFFSFLRFLYFTLTTQRNMENELPNGRGTLLCASSWSSLPSTPFGKDALRID